MKELIIILAFTISILFTHAQVPGAFNYQAIVRNSVDEIIPNQQVSFRINILKGSETGTSVYSETHSVITNNFGLVNLRIGMGDNKTGSFLSEDWNSESHFIKIELDINGGLTFTHIGTSQLLAVPYAFHAATAESITGLISETDPVFSSSVSSGISETDTAKWNNKLDSYSETDPLFIEWDKSYNDLTNAPNIKDSVLIHADGNETKLSAGTDINISGSGTISDPYVIEYSGSDTRHYIGEIYGGGIVFYVYDNGLHGLIASTEDLTDGIKWGNMTTDIPDAESAYDGAANTAAIVEQIGPGLSYAAGLCDAYSGGGQTDWYLPSAWELNLLYDAAYVICFKLENDDDASTHGLNFITPFYWSSTEYFLWSGAWLMDISKGQLLNDLKSNISNVRAVRRF